jgi:hypothetical protein
MASKEKKEREEEEARTATRDSRPGSTVSVSSSSSHKTTQAVIAPSAPCEREGLRRLHFGERRYDINCGSDSAPEWQSEDEDEIAIDEITCS